MKCCKCGIQLAAEDRFCSSCGSPIDQRPAQSPREVLQGLVKTYPEVLVDAAKLKSLLDEHIAQSSIASSNCATTQKSDAAFPLLLNKGLVILLCNVQKSQLIPKLQAVKGPLKPSELDDLSQVLMEDYFINPVSAQSGILVWAYALGVDLSLVLAEPNASEESGPKDDSVREILRFIIRRYPEALTDASLLESKLAPLLGCKRKRECNLLCSTLEYGVPQRLERQQTLAAELLEELVEELERECFFVNIPIIDDAYFRSVSANDYYSQDLDEDFAGKTT